MIFYFYLTFEFMSNNFYLLSEQLMYRVVNSLNNFQHNIYLNLLLYSFVYPGFIFLSLLLKQISLSQIFPEYPTLIPDTLSVGFFNTHPPLLYFSFFVFYLSLSKKFILYIPTLKINFLLATMAFILGGYWGLGNSVWGYFWVNDLIEVLLLSLVLTITFFIHSTKSYPLLFSVYFSVLTLILFILFARAGLLNTRHAFFNLENLNNIYIYFTGLYSSYLVGNIWIVCAICTKWYIYIILIAKFFWLMLTKVNFNFKFKIFHSIILILGLIWIQYAPHNLSFKQVIVEKEFSIFFHVNTVSDLSFVFTSNTLHTIVSSLPFITFIKKITIFGVAFIKYVSIIFLYIVI